MRALRTLPLALLPLVLLTGCITLEVPGANRGPAPSVSAPSNDGGTTPVQRGTVDCDGEAVVVSEPNSDVTVVGDCPEVRLEGADIEVEGASIGTLILRGDRLDADFDDVGDITIEGHDNEVDIDRGGDVTIRGDRNTVDADVLDAVTIDGFDNRLDADLVASVNDSGERNEIDVD